MGERAADERHVLHAGETDIGNELAAAAHQPVVFLAQEPCAYALLHHTEHPRQTIRVTHPRHCAKFILFLE